MSHANTFRTSSSVVPSLTYRSMCIYTYLCIYVFKNVCSTERVYVCITNRCTLSPKWFVYSSHPFTRCHFIHIHTRAHILCYIYTTRVFVFCFSYHNFSLTLLFYDTHVVIYFLGPYENKLYY